VRETRDEVIAGLKDNALGLVEVINHHNIGYWL
jgi:hypothetical protein